MAKTVSSLTAASVRLLIGNSANVFGLLIFGLAFTVVAGNAFFSQSGSHPAALWKTRDMSLTRSIPVKRKLVLVSRSVLTQTVSLKNIPVPMMSPSRRVMSSTHSSIVRDVQSALVKVGFYGGKIDGIYGPATSEAIIAYQESAGTLPDGEASFHLLSNLRSALSVSKSISQSSEPVVKKRPAAVVSLTSDSAMIAQIQQGLAEFGFEKISVDGVMGNQTRKAIRDFQSRFALTVTGEADHKTLAKLVQIGVLNNI